jgi:hypothetical protein
MPTSFRLRLECEGLGRWRVGELAFFEEDAGVVDGQAAVLRWSRSVMSYERSCAWEKLNSWRTTLKVECLSELRQRHRRVRES